ncbi:MAG: hypothetical protein IT304_06760 [Dehalococcoidia bacterium]|nr:hypothetical protein [Dehalococcoidia bacterium]
MTSVAGISEQAPTGDEVGQQRAPRFLLPVSALVWGVAAAVFLLLRLGPIWQAPVGGAELDHLSGAWQARVGADDARFVPTLFQAIVAGILHLTDSEVPARLVAFLVTATLPLALYRLRPHLGQAGALLALILLALDGPAIWLGVAASAMGFDLAIAVWLFVFTLEARRAPWLAAVAGFLVASAGPLALPLLAAWASVSFARRRYPGARTAAGATAGVLVAVLLASLRYDLGADGLRVPPLDLFAAGFDDHWSTATAGELLLLYGLPILVGGAIAAAAEAACWWRGRTPSRAVRLLLAWTAFALAWLIFASTSHQVVPAVGLTLPLALLLGRALGRAIPAMLAADWRFARVLLPLAGLAFVMLAFVVVRWARADAVGDAPSQAKAWLYAVVLVAALLVVSLYRTSRPTLLAAGLAPGIVLLLFGASGVAFSSAGEPLPSPVSPPQARDLRAFAIQAAAERGGVLVVDPAFADALTWPFRDSGNVVVASRVPPLAAVLLWRPEAPRPDGFAPVVGNWALTRAVVPPTEGVLDYLHWLIDRHRLPVTSTPVAVYVRTQQ